MSQSDFEKVVARWINQRPKGFKAPPTPLS